MALWTVLKAILTLGGIVVRHCPITVERDTDLTTLLLLELRAVELDGICVGDDDVVTNTVAMNIASDRLTENSQRHSHPWLPAAIANRAPETVAGVTGCEDPAAVSEDGDAPGLIHGKPVFDAVAEILKADLIFRDKS